MRNNKENKIEYAKYIVEGMKKNYNNNKEYAWMDKILIDNAWITYISVGYNEVYDRIEVIGSYEFPNGYVEKVKIGQYNISEGYGVIWMGNKEKEYVKLHYFQKALIKYWEQQMDTLGDMMSNGLYEMKNNVEQIKYLKSNTDEIINLPLDEKYAIELEKSPNHTTTIKIFKEIFEKEDEYVDAYDVLADRFSPVYHLGVAMYNKFEELVTATIDGEVNIADMDMVCTEMFRTVGYDEFEKFDIKIKILDYKLNKKSPNYEWFMEESEWTGLMTVVDMEKIYAFEDAGLKVELYEDVEEVLVWDVAEQLEGQMGLDDINYEQEVEEMKEMVTISKQQLTNKMKKLGKFLIDERTIEEKENKVFELFPNALEVDVEDNTIHFLVNEEYTGAKPTRKEMLDENIHFGKINDVYGLAIYVSINKNAVVFDANVAVNYSDKWGNREYMDYTVKELEVEIPMTIEKIAYEMSDIYNGVKEGSIELYRAQRSINELMETDVAQDTLVVMDALEKTAEYFKKLHLEEMEKEENERAFDMIYRINKAYEEGRADEEQCLQKILKEIKKASWASTRKLFVDIENKFTKLVEEKYIPDCRILMQGGKAVDVVEINVHNQIHPSGLNGTKIIKYAQGFFHNGDIQNKLSVDQIKRIRDCGFDMDKQVAIAKEIVDEFNLNLKPKIGLEVVKIEKPAEVVRGSYTDCVECGSENFIENSKDGFICHECGEKNTRLIEITEDVTVESLLKLADDLGLPSLDEEVSPEPTAEDVREWQGIKIENKYSKNIFDEYGLSIYLVKETGNLCIDTGSMMYKKINGEPTKTRVDRFLAENKEYEMKLFNDKHVAIPHYIIYKKENEQNE